MLLRVVDKYLLFYSRVDVFSLKVLMFLGFRSFKKYVLKVIFILNQTFRQSYRRIQ